MNKIIKIQIPEGFELDESKSTFEEIILKKKEKFGYYYSVPGVSKIRINTRESSVLQVFKTKEQALAGNALSELSFLLPKERGNYVIVGNQGRGLEAEDYIFYDEFLSFAAEEKRDQFLQKHEKLIKQAAPLLWGVTI